MLFALLNFPTLQHSYACVAARDRKLKKGDVATNQLHGPMTSFFTNAAFDGHSRGEIIAEFIYTAII